MALRCLWLHPIPGASSGAGPRYFGKTSPRGCETIMQVHLPDRISQPWSVMFCLGKRTKSIHIQSKHKQIYAMECCNTSHPIIIHYHYQSLSIIFRSSIPFYQLSNGHHFPSLITSPIPTRKCCSLSPNSTGGAVPQTGRSSCQLK